MADSPKSSKDTSKSKKVKKDSIKPNKDSPKSNNNSPRNSPKSNKKSKQPTSLGSPDQTERKSPDKHTPHNGRRSRQKQSTNISNPSQILPNTLISPIPFENSEFYNAPSTPDSQIESSIAFDGARSPIEGSFPRRKKKKKMKKKSDKRSNAAIPPFVNFNTLESSEDSYNEVGIADCDEVVADKLERIYKPKRSSVGLDASDNINLRIRSQSSSSDDEKYPSKTQYHIRTVNPKHNNFEMVSEGVQTDWSWLRDKQKLHQNELDGADINEVLERLKFGLYGGFAPDKPEIIIKEEHSDISIPCEGSDSNSTGSEETPIDENKNKTRSNQNERKTEVKKLGIRKSEIRRQRPVKSAIKSKSKVDVIKPIRKIKSATQRNILVETETEEVNNQTENNSHNPNKRPSIQPEILKYHREKSGIKNSLPSMCIPDETGDRDLPPADGIYNGPCQFCGKPIMTIPPWEDLGEDGMEGANEFFCCPEYKFFIKLHLESLEFEKGMDDTELIDINPHAPYGAKQNKKVARDRVAERVRERELERQRVATQQANLFTFARQMKTIQYSLASAKCWQEGWTMRPETPKSETPNGDDDFFQIEDNSTLLQKSDVLNVRLYENGKTFLTIFPDGTGCCYYPSGNVAVMITSTEKDKYTYIVQSAQSYDSLEDAGLLAVFEPTGNGICYFEKKQKIRLFLNRHGGIELDKHGRRRKRWQWYFVKGHSHTPPFQPLCFPLNKFLSVRVLDQDNIALIFSAQKRSVRFNVGANLTVHGIEGHGNFVADESERFLAEKKKELSALLKEIQCTLRFPKSALSSRLATRRTDGQKMISPRDILPPISSNESSVYVN